MTSISVQKITVSLISCLTMLVIVKEGTISFQRQMIYMKQDNIYNILICHIWIIQLQRTVYDCRKEH